eukprot:TRINITY_DN16696_c0_g1_i1.p1 TRINITY_DN16696_c0_g1~~TRINITY_DN16696_c0_g1_i1.p1  ORF type:complete len:288 (+),score=55.63 TRINITY_DN16696_c0_g1_i1:230-1093(+)
MMMMVEWFLLRCGMAILMLCALSVRGVLAESTRSAGNCWGVVDRSSEILQNINTNMEPLMPIFECSPAAITIFNKENLDKCVQVVLDILDVGKLMDKLMGMVNTVKSVLLKIQKACMDMIGKIGECLQDLGADGLGASVSGLSDDLSRAVQVDSILDGMPDLFKAIATLIAEFASIGETVKPLATAWQEANFLEAAVFEATHFQESRDAFNRFMPAWNSCKEHYESTRGCSGSAYESAKLAWTRFHPLLQKICELTGTDMPEGLSLRDAMPTVADSRGLMDAPEFED